MNMTWNVSHEYTQICTPYPGVFYYRTVNVIVDIFTINPSHNNYPNDVISLY